MKHRQVSATDFKAKCLSLMDEINETGGSVTITKRGRPIAVLQPVPREAFKSSKGMFEGQIQSVGDIVNFSMGEAWEMVRDMKSAEARSAGKGRRKAS
jgi:prevent-host-death family protein